MEASIRTLGFLVTVSSLVWMSSGCGTRYAGGWGAPAPLIVFPQPTLIPKLKAAFLDGKASVAFKGRPIGGGWVGSAPHPISLPLPVAPIKLVSPLELNGVGWAPNYDDFGGVNSRGYHAVNGYHPGGSSYSHLDYEIYHK